MCIPTDSVRHPPPPPIAANWLSLNFDEQSLVDIAIKIIESYNYYAAKSPDIFAYRLLFMGCLVFIQ